MSANAEPVEHEREVEADNDQMIKRLDAIILLLEILANVEINSTLKIVSRD